MYHGTPTERAELRDTKMRPELLDIPLASKKPIPGGTGRIPVFPVVSPGHSLVSGIGASLKNATSIDRYDVRDDNQRSEVPQPIQVEGRYESLVSTRAALTSTMSSL